MSASSAKPNEATGNLNHPRNSDLRNRPVESGENTPRSFVADESFAREPTNADAWDKEIQADAKAGKLDALLEEARNEHREETTRPLP